MRFVIYKDRRGQWRWSLRARNQKVIADGSESYTRKRDVLLAVRRVVLGVISATCVVEIA